MRILQRHIPTPSFFKGLGHALFLLLLWGSFQSVVSQSINYFELSTNVEQRQFPFVEGHFIIKDEWLGQDKLKHFGVSAFLTVQGYGVFQQTMDLPKQKSLVLGSSISLGFGVLKEAYDHKKGTSKLFSIKDLVADILGISFANALIYLVDN